MDRAAPALQPATLTIGPAAAYLGVSISTLRRWTHDGILPHARYAGRLHYKVDDLHAFVNDRMVEA